MTQNSPTSVRSISPATEFVLLLVPVVMSCFFMVYALVGWIVEGPDKLTWSVEAENGAIWVGSGIVAYCLLVMLYAHFKGGSRRQKLTISSVFHIVLSIVLAASIFACTRL